MKEIKMFRFSIVFLFGLFLNQEIQASQQPDLIVRDEMTDQKLRSLQNPRYKFIHLYRLYTPSKYAYTDFFHPDTNPIISPKLIHTHVTQLGLQSCGLGEEHLKEIGQYTQLKNLSLADNDVTDKVISFLTPLTQLESLDLGLNNIGDEGVRQLAQLTQLRELNLSHNKKVTDKGLDALKDNINLKKLKLIGTYITMDKYNEMKENWTHLEKLEYFPR